MTKQFLSSVRKTNDDLKKSPLKATIILITLLSSYFLLKNIFLALVISMALTILVFGYESLVFFVLGIVLITPIPFLLIIEKNVLAKDLAEYSYYMLTAGLVVIVLQYLINPKPIQKRS